ncbi:MAG: 3' terminal RNA ribose 2'-O-methyltransferase Hen1 [Armatimonadetes bacterium]|nr:3' terminal RNA ribose 2'-O-methyltransferase Hen1 [Armatimonadota bacterium]
MIFSLTCTATEAAPDSAILGYLLHKHPDKWFEKPLTFGTANVYYPESSPERTTACLAVRIDPVAIVRGGSKSAPASLAEYVSDRPYAASSFLSVAIAEVFGTALGGRCEKFPEAVDAPLALSATVYALPCDGGAAAIRRVFEPLGYTVTADATPELLDDRFPQWGEANLFTVTVAGAVTVRDCLSHLYVLVPVLDNAKHYFVADDEVEKLLRRGGDWLSAHPAKEYITARYLRYRRTLTDAALLRLSEVAEVEPEPDTVAAPEPAPVVAAKTRLNDERIAAAIEAIRSAIPSAKRVLDLGCGEGKTLFALREAFPALENLTGMDVSPLTLTRASRRLKLDRQEGDAKRIELLHGSLVYHDARLQGFDIALLMEVVEHIEPDRLPDVERNVFGFMQPRRLVVTTPNAEYNTVWESLPGGEFRHTDHRFEWTRAQFAAWAKRIAETYGYSVAFSGVGEADSEGRGTPTQMAVFDLSS